MASDSNPLEGLTADQADDTIARFAAKVDQNEESLKAQKQHLKQMRAARKSLDEPIPLDQRAAGTDAHAEPATITTEASGV